MGNNCEVIYISSNDKVEFNVKIVFDCRNCVKDTIKDLEKLKNNGEHISTHELCDGLIKVFK